MDADAEQVDPLDLQSLDTDSLLTALAAVERVSGVLPDHGVARTRWPCLHRCPRSAVANVQAVPDLLLDVKPVLAHLTAPNEGTDEAGAVAARDAVDRYMATVDVSVVSP